MYKKSIIHAHSGPKKTQGVTPRPRPVRMLLSLCCFDLRNVVWWREVSPEILVTIELLSLDLLGRHNDRFVGTKINEDMHGLTYHREPTK